MNEVRSHYVRMHLNENMEKLLEWLPGPPFYSRSACPLTTDHPRPRLRSHYVSHWRGDDRLAWHGDVGYVIGASNFGLPNRDDVKAGVIAYKIAAPRADLAKGHPRARRVGRCVVEGGGFDFRDGRITSQPGARSVTARAYHDETMLADGVKVAHLLH